MSMVDARGLSCPQPVVLAKKAMDNGNTPVEILLDSQVSIENVTRYAENNGWHVTKNDNGLKLEKR